MVLDVDRGDGILDGQVPSLHSRRTSRIVLGERSRSGAMAFVPSEEVDEPSLEAEHRHLVDGPDDNAGQVSV